MAKCGGQAVEICALNRDLLPHRVLGQTWSGPVPDIEAALAERLGEHEPGGSSPPAYLAPRFLEEEFERVIYGRACLDEDAYLEVDREGRLSALGPEARRVVWGLLQRPPLDSFVQRRVDAYRSHLDQIQDACQLQLGERWTHVFVDECQDFTPADLRLLARVPPDPEQLVVAGDETQSLHLGASYRVPQISGRKWKVHRLGGSYRVPRRAALAILPVAQQLQRSHQGSRGDELDLVLLESRRSALPGPRPVVIAGGDRTAANLRRVVNDYRDFLTARDEAVLVLEGDPALRAALDALSDIGVTKGHMDYFKGLEWPAVVFSDRALINTEESLGEWVFTALSRAATLLVIVLWPDGRGETKTWLGRLDPDHLLFWDKPAREAFDHCASLSTN